MYKPSNNQQTSSAKTPGVAPNGVAYKYPKLAESGSYSARISLIVDIGTQERDDFVDPKTNEATPQKPAQQLVIFADLVDEVVDYGGDIGEKQYRLMLNKNFKGEIEGVNFTPVPPRDGDGKIVEGKLWTFHPANLLTKLAKATGNEHILGTDIDSNMDISALLGAAFQADVEVKETESDKKDSEGNNIVYTNINFKQAAKVPKKLQVDELQVEPMILNHNNVTEETLKYIRGKVVEMMKKAAEYEGSKLQKLLAAKEESSTEPSKEGTKVKEEKKPATTVKPKEKAKPKATPVVEEAKDTSQPQLDDDEPF
jgi:hypothetical protein